MPLRPGDRIERYIIDAPLGAGGMGDVYRAHDARLERQVALKILRIPAEAAPGTPASSRGADRMLREARAAAALDHPNVVSIFDVGQVDSPEELRGTTYLAMELINGASLRAFVGDLGVPIARRVGWLTDVARALGAAHAAGIVHRDVKPENVMIREDGRVKVLDFGIAKKSAAVSAAGGATPAAAAGTLTAEGVVVGTPLYMSPEQMRGEALDGRADQFSWGVVAYELLTGKVPWPVEAGSLAVVAQILSGEPVSLVGRGELPPHVAEAVMRALGKDPARRFPSMAELVAAFAGTGLSPMASSGEMPRTSRPPAEGASMSSLGGFGATGPGGDGRLLAAARSVDGRARRRRAWAGVLGASAVIAGLAGGTVAWRRARDPRESAAVPPVLGGCASNRVCVESHGGEPYVCRRSDRTCVALASEDCTPMYEPRDLLADDTVWLGAMFPTTGPETGAHGAMSMAGTDFAREEIAKATSSLDGSNTALALRRIALVGCDDAKDPMRAAKHLVEDVGVPAIIGFHSGKETLEIAGSLLIQRNVITVAPLTTSPLITRLPQRADLPRMVWRTTFSSTQAAEATAQIIPVLESRRAKEITRVTLLREDNAGSLAFAESFYRKLRINGKSALENSTAYREVVLKEGELTPEGIAGIAARIGPPAPTFLVIIGLPRIVKSLLETLEAQTLGPKPTYIAEMGSTEYYLDFIRASSDRRHRLFAVNSLSNSTANARFVIRYNETHKEQVSRTLNPGPSYDAFYLLAYATFALGANPASGPELARAIARLVPPGLPIEVGPTDVFEAITTLARGGRIDLTGTQSALDYDLSTGEEPSDFALICSQVDDGGRATGEDLESGVVFRAATGKVEGTLSCP